MINFDCPFVEMSEIKKVIKIFNTNKFDYVSTLISFTTYAYPDGSDTEIFSFDALKKIKLIAKTSLG